MRTLGTRRYTSKRRSDSQRKAIFANIAQHQGLVKRNVSQQLYRTPHLSHLRNDLTSAGNLGLVEFAGRYNPKRGAKFSTGATQAIRSRIQREMFKGSTVRVPEKPLRRM